MRTERLKKIFSYRRILRDMTVKQLKIKYSGSRLGIWWAVITPLILALSINFVFTNVFKVSIPYYTLFVLSGIIPWIFFSTALSEATNSFIVNVAILRQAVFPREFVPASTVLANFLNFSIGFFILLPLFIIIKLKVIAFFPLLILPLALQLIFVTGMGFIFSCWNVFFRDVSHLLSIVLLIWFWVTPVFYSIDMLPFAYRWICLLNPMSYYVVLYRQILFQAELPSIAFLAVAFLISLASLLIGYWVFVRKETKLLKELK